MKDNELTVGEREFEYDPCPACGHNMAKECGRSDDADAEERTICTCCAGEL